VTVSYSCRHCDYEIEAESLSRCMAKLLLHLRFDSCFEKLHKDHWVRGSVFTVLWDAARLWWTN
jgi:hypothetical protein